MQSFLHITLNTGAVIETETTLDSAKSIMQAWWRGTNESRAIWITPPDPYSNNSGEWWRTSKVKIILSEVRMMRIMVPPAELCDDLVGDNQLPDDTTPEGKPTEFRND